MNFWNLMKGTEKIHNYLKIVVFGQTYITLVVAMATSKMMYTQLTH